MNNFYSTQITTFLQSILCHILTISRLHKRVLLCNYTVSLLTSSVTFLIVFIQFHVFWVIFLYHCRLPWLYSSICIHAVSPERSKASRRPAEIAFRLHSHLMSVDVAGEHISTVIIFFSRMQHHRASSQRISCRLPQLQAMAGTSERAHPTPWERPTDSQTVGGEL